MTLVSAWVSQVARSERIDTAILATRADLVELLGGDPDARLAHGWRAEVLGDGITRLVAGHAALTFDREGGLRLVDVPAEALTCEAATPSASAADDGAELAPEGVEGGDRLGGAAAVGCGSGGARRSPG